MEKLTSNEIQELFERVLSVVKNKPPEFFNLRKMNGCVGLCYFTDIELDYRRDIIPTAMHEIIHYLHCDWSETKVRYAESRLINNCTSLQIATFMKLLSDKIYKSECLKWGDKQNKN